VGMFVPVIGGWFAWPARLLLTYMLEIANLLSRIPHAFLENLSFSFSAMLLSYGIIAFLCVIIRRTEKQRMLEVPTIQSA
jgi:hypothetical protein